MKNASWFSPDATEDMAKACDGCGKSDAAAGLFPIGDGSIQVCADCYTAATALFFTPKRLSANTA